MRHFFYLVDSLKMSHFYFCYSFLSFYPYYNDTITHKYQCPLWKKRVFHLFLSGFPPLLGFGAKPKCLILYEEEGAVIYIFWLLYEKKNSHVRSCFAHFVTYFHNIKFL